MMLPKRIYPWVGLTAIACLALVAANLVDARAAAIPAKLLASTSFLITAWVAGAFRSRYGRVLFFGLVLSWCGDALLLGTTDTLFLFGLAAFLLAHVAYVIAFMTRGLNLRWVLAALIPVALVSSVFMAWLTPRIPAEMLIVGSIPAFNGWKIQHRKMKKPISRFHGVFAPNFKHREKIVPRQPRGKVDSDLPLAPMAWAQRLKRVFQIDIEACPECGGKLRVTA